jgi:hypothetical protein
MDIMNCGPERAVIKANVNVFHRIMIAAELHVARPHFLTQFLTHHFVTKLVT